MRFPRFPKRRNRARRAIDNRLAVPGPIEPAALFESYIFCGVALPGHLLCFCTILAAAYNECVI
jgi:hypothetical protein